MTMPKQDTELRKIFIDSQTHYERVCLICGYSWLGLHCPHDGYQNPCPRCDKKPKTIKNKGYTDCNCIGTIDLDDLEDLLISWRDKSVNEARKPLLELIDDFVWDNDDCHYDQQGYCQTHSLDERPCPHERAKKILNNLNKKGEE